MCLSAVVSGFAADYVPSPEIKKAQAQFEDARFGIFLHWGLYSMFAQGEWYLNYGVNAEEYAKSARAFYPADFDAAAWVSAIKAAGLKIYMYNIASSRRIFDVGHKAVAL